MLESHLVEGRQDYVPGRPAVYGQSITDACISLEQTEEVLEQLAHAQQARQARQPLTGYTASNERRGKPASGSPPFRNTTVAAGGLRRA